MYQISSSSQLLPIPPIGAFKSSSNISLPSSFTGASGQTFTITSSANSDFANLPIPSGQSGIFFVTASFPSGSQLAFGSTMRTFTVDATTDTLTPGSVYTVSYFVNGTQLSSSPLMATATSFSNSGGTFGEINTLTPFNNLTLNANDVLGIVVSH